MFNLSLQELKGSNMSLLSNIRYSNLSDIHQNQSITCITTITYSYSPKIETENTYVKLINDRHFLLNEILDWLSNTIEMSKYAISYYDSELEAYIYIGIYPIKQNVFCGYTKGDKIAFVKLKLREIVKKEGLLRMELLEEENDNIDESKSHIFISAKSKRAKERKIGDIIEKVYMWRKLYSGYVNEKGKEIKLSLEEAADKIGISKKSLDDYLIQLRIGKMYGFNFNEHKNDKVGILRAFVKKNKHLIANRYQNSFGS